MGGWKRRVAPDGVERRQRNHQRVLSSGVMTSGWCLTPRIPRFSLGMTGEGRAVGGGGHVGGAAGVQVRVGDSSCDMAVGCRAGQVGAAFQS